MIQLQKSRFYAETLQEANYFSELSQLANARTKRVAKRNVSTLNSMSLAEGNCVELGTLIYSLNRIEDV